MDLLIVHDIMHCLYDIHFSSQTGHVAAGSVVDGTTAAVHRRSTHPSHVYVGARPQQSPNFPGLGETIHQHRQSTPQITRPHIPLSQPLDFKQNTTSPHSPRHTSAEMVRKQSTRPCSGPSECATTARRVARLNPNRRAALVNINSLLLLRRIHYHTHHTLPAHKLKSPHTHLYSHAKRIHTTRH